MAPEGAPPGVVQIIERLITRLQPVAKLSLTTRAVALAAVFIGNMPAQHRRVL